MDDQGQPVDADEFFANMDSEEQPEVEQEEVSDEIVEEGEELEEEPDDEEGDDDDEQDEEAEAELYRVTIKNERGEDEEVDLSLEDLAAGHMRQADYTRKRGEDAAKVRAIETEYTGKLLEASTQSAERLEQLKAFVIQSATPELSQLTPELAQQDPARYVELQAKQGHVSNLLAQLDQQQQAESQQAEQIQQHQHQEFLGKCQEYVNEAIPELNDQEFQAQLYQFADEHYQISQQELQWLATAPQFKDGRYLDSGKMMKIITDAMSFQKIQKDKPMARKKIQSAPKRIKPRAPKPKSRHKEDMKRVKRGDRDAADRLLANL